MTADGITRDLAANFAGEIVGPLHPRYDDARRVWNGLVDRRPALIARCSGTADVVRAVRAAAEHRPVVSVRAGGHQVAGSAVCDDGLVIDLSPMKAVWVDPARRVVRAQAGVTWAELDAVTIAHGLAVPGGDAPGTGVAGVALGGGIGPLLRRYGLSCDNLRAIEIVTADGQARVAAPDGQARVADVGGHGDLLWAARGCGRGLGVVTWLEFTAHPLGPDVATAQVFYPHGEAERVVRAWRDLAGTLPAAVTTQLVLRDTPRGAIVPPELRGVPSVAVGGVYAGPPEEAEVALAPLRSLAEPLMDLSRVMPYTQPHRPPATAGRAYMKSHFFDALTDQAVRVMLDRDARRTGPDSAVTVRALGGTPEVARDHGAYPHRAALFNVNVHATWHDPALDDEVTGWCADTWNALRPHANGGVYLGFAGPAEGFDAVREAAYGASAARVEEIRTHHDPTGLFKSAALQP